MAKVIKSHSCDLFVLNENAFDPVNANCGVCIHFNNDPPTPVHRICLQHDKLVEWARKNFRSDWSNKQ